MKLRNKKTGEIDDFIFEVIKDRIDLYRRVGHSETNNIWHYDSLAEFNEEWEDYEEPMEHWCITMYGGITRIKDDEEPIDDLIEIGNYFNSKEDAYDAWDKLKAWKRLKDKGFRFEGYNSDFEGYWVIYPNDTEGTWCLAQDKADLDLLFGGEE